MTTLGVVTERYALWADLLDSFGWEREHPPRPPKGVNDVVLLARRPELYGGPSATITIEEAWWPGSDPLGLQNTERGGCCLWFSGWHAQIGGGQDECAERLDVDRREELHCVVHRHP